MTPHSPNRFFKTATRRYAAIGAAFGFLFPVVATLITVLEAQLPLSLASVIAVQQADPLLWIIDTAPLFLGLFAAIAGRREDSLQQANVLLQAASVKLIEEQDIETRQYKERAAQLNMAVDVGKIITSSLDAQQLMKEVVNLITERFGFYYAAIFLLDNSGSYLLLREAAGEAAQILKERGHRLRLGLDSMVGYAAMKHEPRVAVNAGEDAVRFANPLLPATQSEIALPLIVGDEVLGALDVQATQLNAFDEAAIATLKNMTAQISVALKNAQSYSDLQQALTFTTGQYEVSRAIVTARTAREAYQALGQVFVLLSGIDRISLWRVSDRDALGQPSEYEVATEWDVLGGAQFGTGLRYRAAETPFSQLVKPAEVVVIGNTNDSRLPLSAREHLAQVGAQAVMLVPLTMRERYEGFMAVVAEHVHDFQASEIRLLSAAAELLGVVLSNVQLATEMQTTVERAALLNRRLSGEAWGSYLVGRDQWLVESGQAQQDQVIGSLQVPIVVRGETIGTFDVADARADHQWQEDELTMLQTIAGEVALAIDNARLIEQTQRAAQREKDIASAADKIHRSVNLDAILQTAVHEVMRIAGTTEVAIQLGRADTAHRDGQPAALEQGDSHAG